MATKQGEYEMVTVRLFEGDKEVISRFFPKQGYNDVIRKLVNKFANQLREKENEILSEIDIEGDFDATAE